MAVECHLNVLFSFLLEGAWGKWRFLTFTRFCRGPGLYNSGPGTIVLDSITEDRRYKYLILSVILTNAMWSGTYLLAWKACHFWFHVSHLEVLFFFFFPYDTFFFHLHLNHFYHPESTSSIIAENLVFSPPSIFLSRRLFEYSWTVTRSLFSYVYPVPSVKWNHMNKTTRNIHTENNKRVEYTELAA